MKKQIIQFLTILLIIIPIFAQSATESEQKLKKGNEIVSNARKAIGLGEKEIQSFSYKIKNISLNSNSAIPSVEMSSETKVILPNKINSILFIGQNSESVRIWNGEKYKSFLVMDMMGNRIVKDTTNPEESSSNNENLKVLEGRVDKDKLEAFKKASTKKRPDPKISFNEELWTDFFPLTLSHPFEKNLEFVFVGKAQAGSKTADVVDFTPSNGKKYRLLFDTETNYLLMMIVNYHREDPFFTGDVETKYYFSERENTEGILFPKTIKAEIKQTAADKSTRILHSETKILEFKINQKIDEKIFEIK